MNFLLSFLAFIVLLAILVGFHEWGHLLVARANSVFCEVFSFGMGPKIFERTDKFGTKWRISLFPIGGYVKMFGDADATSVKEKIPTGYTEEDMQKMSAFRKKPWQRILIAFGGPVANFVLAIVLLFGLSVIKGIPEPSNEIIVISEDTLAYKAGLRSKDKIIRINDNNVTSFKEVYPKLKNFKGKDFSITVDRSGETKTFPVKMYTDNMGKRVPVKKLGIRSDGYVYKTSTVKSSFVNACKTTWDVTVGNISGIAKIFQKKESIENIGGIISIFQMSVHGAGNGFTGFVMTLVMLSIMLGAMNLLPIPCLDGGAILINTIEWIRGKRLNEKTIEVIFTFGLIIVAGLMLLGLWNDVSRLSIFSKIINFFK